MAKKVSGFKHQKKLRKMSKKNLIKSQGTEKFSWKFQKLARKVSRNKTEISPKLRLILAKLLPIFGK